MVGGGGPTGPFVGVAVGVGCPIGVLDGVAVGVGLPAGLDGVAVGVGLPAGLEGVAVGVGLPAGLEGVAVGVGLPAGLDGVAVGVGLLAGLDGVAVGVAFAPCVGAALGAIAITLAAGNGPVEVDEPPPQAASRIAPVPRKAKRNRNVKPLMHRAHLVRQPEPPKTVARI